MTKSLSCKSSTKVHDILVLLKLHNSKANTLIADTLKSALANAVF